MLLSPAHAATYYVDASAAVNGAGTQASPFNSWAGVIWQAGATYLQKGGTTYPNTVVVSGSRVTIPTPLMPAQTAATAT